MFLLKDYDYHLPEELIAQRPIPRRDHSRLLFLHRKTGEISHHSFRDILNLFNNSDVLVVNNTKVIPARLFGQKETGGKAEVLILDYPKDENHMISQGECVCQCLIKTSKRPKDGTALIFNRELRAEVVNFKAGIYSVRFSYNGDLGHIISRIGHIPLPPYIKRNDDQTDRKFYQTVYASQKGAVAAPTAGLHFSQSLMKKLKEKGVKIVAITLHVGYGTFLPVKVSDIRDHRIHSEWYSISKEAAGMINESKKAGHRIIAVGTTSVRTLEFAAKKNGIVAQGAGRCDLFIYPGYKFKTVDALLTNFHLPKSTLLMLVSAFSTLENVLNAYKTAVENKYRFFSYGDAMLIA
jgi:S-adenosylmethionine:tRNA ribosyltransferase-isomerase